MDANAEAVKNRTDAINTNLDLSRVPQVIFERVNAYQHAEMAWMDAYVRLQWPRWVCYLAERDGFMAHLLRVFVARYSSLQVVRNNNASMSVVGKPGKGFRAGHQPNKQVIDSITTTIFKHKRACKEVVIAGGQKARPNCSDACVVAKQTFTLGVPI